jgi:gentisate 1,2-dioxygenase
VTSTSLRGEEAATPTAPAPDRGTAPEPPLASPVRLRAEPGEGRPDVTPALEELYRGFERELLVPLWTEIGDLMPLSPRSKASAHVWRWDRLRALAAEAGELVPVGRGGERRAIALANPSLGGRPFASPTLWAAIQYLMPGEDAPEHRHTQHAFRFVVEGEGVWTVVGGDPVAMRRGDFLPQAGWNWHAHHNATSQPMAWIDGLDIPFQYTNEAQFFEFGRDALDEAEHATPARSRSERLWGHPGLRPLGARPAGPGTPLLAYRWEHTDRALADQLAVEAEGFGGTVEPGHAAVRFTDPASGADVLPTLRAEVHRVRRGTETAPVRETGSSVYQVFDGAGTVTIGDSRWSVTRGDLFVVPSWQPFSVRSEAGAGDSDSGALDLFRFSDAPVFEALRLDRRAVGNAPAPTPAPTSAPYSAPHAPAQGAPLEGTPTR